MLVFAGMRTFADATATDAQLRSCAEGGVLRVLMVSARFFPDLGGTETHTHEITRRLAMRRDIDLTVLTTDRSGTRPVREEFDGFTILRCRSYPRNRDYYFAPGIYRQILNHGYDLVHCQGIHTAVPIIAMTAARRKHIPYIVTLHLGGHSSNFRHRLRNVQWRTLSPLLRGAAVIVTVSRFEQRVIQEACSLDQTHFRIIQNGGELPLAQTPAAVVPGRIVSCGRLERYKGHQRLIEALPIVRRSVPGATLHILGSGPYESQLRARIDALGLGQSIQIEHIGPDNRRRIAESLNQAAVAAALSEYESHPLAVMEALALGVPVVGLNVAGMSDLVADGLVTGVPKDASPSTVSQILVTALQGQRASVSTSLPTWDDAAAGLVSLYREATGAAPGSLR